MAVSSRSLHGSGNTDEIMVVCAGSRQPEAVTAGDYDDELLSPTDPSTTGLSVMYGHVFVDMSSFTAGGGNVSIGVILKASAISPNPNFDSYTIATTHSAVTSPTEANKAIPDTGTVGTGLPVLLTGMVLGMPIGVGNPWYIPTLRVHINTGLTSAPVVRYIVYLRCCGAKRS